MTASNKSMSQKMRAVELTGNVTSQGGSIGSAFLPAPVSGAQGAASNRSRVIVPSLSKWQKPGEVPSQSKRMRLSRPAKVSTASAITEVPSSLEPGEKTDYNETKTMYEKFWTECQDCFVFEVDRKFSISIDQMERAPKIWTIREYEEHGMPDTEEKPTDWEQIANGKFFIING
jgi:hypothetical protein